MTKPSIQINPEQFSIYLALSHTSGAGGESAGSWLGVGWEMAWMGKRRSGMGRPAAVRRDTHRRRSYGGGSNRKLSELIALNLHFSISLNSNWKNVFQLSQIGAVIHWIYRIIWRRFIASFSMQLIYFHFQLKGPAVRLINVLSLFVIRPISN